MKIRAIRLGASLLLAAATLGGCARHPAWHDTDISGSLPKLAFQMVRAKDGQPVTAADFQGKVTLLYFGYTYCPDACPTTLSNIAQVLKRMGPLADSVRVLFVTVDPTRDTLPVLRQYDAAFAPQVVGLRGDDNALAALAKRYRIAYSVTPASPGHPYEVTHGSGVYVFDRQGDARLLVSTLSTEQPDLAGVTQDLSRLAREG